MICGVNPQTGNLGTCPGPTLLTIEGKKKKKPAPQVYMTYSRRMGNNSNSRMSLVWDIPKGREAMSQVRDLPVTNSSMPERTRKIKVFLYLRLIS